MTSFNYHISGNSNEYFIKIKRRIKDILASRSRPFVEIIRECAGAYPTIIHECLQELNGELVNTCVPAYALRSSIDTKIIEPLVSSEIEGNPILCSWYFTVDTCRRISDLRDWSKLKLAFLSTPRLYEWFRIHNLGKERLLLDLDSIVLDKLSSSKKGMTDTIIRYDVADEIPKRLKGQYDCVFFDSPWYPDD